MGGFGVGPDSHFFVLTFAYEQDCFLSVDYLFAELLDLASLQLADDLADELDIASVSVPEVSGDIGIDGGFCFGVKSE